MAYRKTEKVLAQIEARRASIIAAAIDVIAKSGLEDLTTDNVAERGGFSVGIIYKYFPDKTELIAASVAHLLARDVAAIRAAAVGNPIEALAGALMVFYYRLENPRLVRALADHPAYREGIRDEMARLIRPAVEGLSPKDRQIAAAGCLGALYGLVDASGPSKLRLPAALLFVLRGIGVSEREASKIVSQRHLLPAQSL